MESQTESSTPTQELPQHDDGTLTPKQLAAAVAGILAGALLLRIQPVRSLAKLGALGAVGWTVYRFAGDIGLLSPTPSAARRAAADLAASSQRLAEAWGAHYRAPQVDATANDVARGESA